MKMKKEMRIIDILSTEISVNPMLAEVIFEYEAEVLNRRVTLTDAMVRDLHCKLSSLNDIELNMQYQIVVNQNILKNYRGHA